MSRRMAFGANQSNAGSHLLTDHPVLELASDITIVGYLCGVKVLAING